ncbi:hypothetical protein [Roseateles terrae]|uniref:Flagellar hook-length control protein-like C-terminal domain-containing protein n=1 Tax=Roseateles terrae TaxID=431060 RepID=A0ABR6GWZ3_9BURK|nr:hypothetical protein [Roseateles terrae]MBB3196631.1 hypothetical protein [Roseateles terrae]
MATGSSSSLSPISAVSATARISAPGRDPQSLQAGDLLRLTPGSRATGGWTLESLEGSQVLSLIQPPMDDLAPGDEVLMRVVSVSPRLSLEVVERRGRGPGVAAAVDASAFEELSGERPADATRSEARTRAAGPGNTTADLPGAERYIQRDGQRDGRRDGAGLQQASAPLRGDSTWAQLSSLRADLAGWRRQMLSDPGMPSRSLSTAQLVQGWAQALQQGRPPVSPGGEPFWLLPQPYWLRHERHERDGASSESPRSPEPELDDEPALSLLFKWKDAAIGMQLQGPRHALKLILLAESEQVLTALRSELPALVAALVRAGVRLQRLGWRQQALWVPVDPFPDLRADPGLLSAAAELMLALR